ncbi:5'-flap endonuclease [Malassezia pachydermatis]|uniref:Flap endonuclease gen-like protein 1 n=1 Tax=Malassezia pachydermatis TaxID=77020 RepID=A0A0M8MPX4_9BASI|nr:flap endonuclease gen-like protein 1 [Malassezia pachydermatis]KOS14447.1 flap endonuclease gen-like protein 1 [Malassezia pachydermatis]
MGVPGLWRELAPTGIDTTLEQLAWAHWERTDQQRYRIGIDASQWLFHARKARGGAQPALRMLFFRALKLLHIPVWPVFVFDGPSRPAWKRDADVWLGPFPLEAQWQSFLDALGFAYWRAPGEAEAELAWMNSRGDIDVVWTDDVDALLFGAQRVLRPPSKTNNTDSEPERQREAQEDRGPLSRAKHASKIVDDTWTLYDMATSAWPIKAAGLILVALLAGGDYHPQGLPSCGVKTALGLARTGLGQVLAEAYDAYQYTTRDEAAWASSMATWREAIQAELISNASGYLTKKQPKLARLVSVDLFGTQRARDVLRDYMHPRTSKTDPTAQARWEKVRRAPRSVDLASVGQLVQTHFEWPPTVALQKLERLLLPGMCMQRLLQISPGPSTPPRPTSPAREPMTPVSRMTHSLARLQAHSPTRPAPWVALHTKRMMQGRIHIRMSLNTEAFYEDICASLTVAKPAACSVRLWVPMRLAMAQPGGAQRIQAFLTSAKPKKANSVPTDQTRLTSYFVCTKRTMTSSPSPSPPPSPTRKPAKSREASELRLPTRGLPPPSVDDTSVELVRVVPATEVIVISDSSSDTL